MLAPRRDDASYLSEIYALVQSTLRENLGRGPFVLAVEAVLDTLRVEKVEEASFLLLPLQTCQVVGGDPHQAVAVAAAWCMLHSAALLLDDVQDGELASKPWPDMTPAQAINVATALVSAAPLVLAHLSRKGARDSLVLALYQTFGHALLQVCAGQHLDLARGTVTLEEYWELADGKSGACFALACRAGAMVGTGEPQLIDRCGEFGRNLGILVQISDDFNGVWNVSGAGDLFAGSRTLPVVYALTVAPLETRTQLLEFLSRAPSEEPVAAEVRQTIVDLGALQYLMVQAEMYRRRARKALPCLDRDRCTYDQLLAMLDRIMPSPRVIP